MKEYMTPELEVIEIEMQGSVLLEVSSGENPTQHDPSDEIPVNPGYAD